MKLKKMICGLAALVTMFSACVMPASAVGIDISDSSDSPSFLDSYDYCFNHMNKTNYLVYKDESSGTYYQMTGGYNAVFITADENTDMQEIYDFFGNEQSSLEDSLGLDENQHAFGYIKDFDYESLYAIDGVEKVELSSIVFSAHFELWCRFYEGDTWREMSSRDLMEILVETESDVELTEEMFADTGYNVPHVYKKDETDGIAEWVVYYEKTGEKNSSPDFIEKAKQIDGIISAELGYWVFDCSTQTSYISTEIADLIGDVNGDGIVNISDLILMKRYMLESISADSLDISKSDLNKDGDLSVSDYTSIKKRMLK